MPLKQYLGKIHSTECYIRTEERFKIHDSPFTLRNLREKSKQNPNEGNYKDHSANQ